MHLSYVVVVFMSFLAGIDNSRTTVSSATSEFWIPYQVPSTTNTTTAPLEAIESLSARFDRHRLVEGRCMFCDAELTNSNATLRFENLACLNWEWMAPDYTAEEAACLILRAGAVASCGCPITNAYSYNADDNDAVASCNNLCVEDYQEVNRLKPIEVVPFVTCGDIESFPAVDGNATCDLFRREIAPICCANRTRATTNDDDDKNSNNDHNNLRHNSQQFTGAISLTESTRPQAIQSQFGMCKFCDDMGSLDLTLRLDNIPCIEWSWFANFATEDQCLLLRAGAVQACGCPLVDHTGPCTNFCMEGQVLNGTKSISLIQDAPLVNCREVASYPAVDGTQTCDYLRQAIAPLCCTDSSATTHIDNVEREADPSSRGSRTTSSLFDIPNSLQSQSWLGGCQFCDMYSRLLDPNLTFQHTPCITWDLLAGFATQEQCLILRAGAVEACGCPIDSANNAPCDDICGSDDQVINSTKPIGLIDYAPHITCGDVASFPAVDGTATCDYFRQVIAPICCKSASIAEKTTTTDSSLITLVPSSAIKESFALSPEILESFPTHSSSILRAQTVQPLVGVCKICHDNSHLDLNLSFFNIACMNWVWYASFATEEQCLIVRAGAAEACRCPIDSANITPCQDLCTGDHQVINTSKVVHLSDDAPSITCGDIASYPAVDGTATCNYLRQEIAPICCMETYTDLENKPSFDLSSTRKPLTSLDPDPLPQTAEPLIGGCKFCDTESADVVPTRQYQDIYCVDWEWFIANVPREECLILRAGAVEACGCPINATNNVPCNNFCSENQIVNTTKRIGLVAGAPGITCGDVASYPAVDGVETCDYFRKEISPICCMNTTENSFFVELEDGTRSTPSSSLLQPIVDSSDNKGTNTESESDVSVDKDGVVSPARETDGMIVSYYMLNPSGGTSWRLTFSILQLFVLCLATI